MNDKQRSEDQKWNEWLEENCRIQVEYPDMAEMEQQKNRILQSALPEKDSLFERLKKIYYGPGLGIIFYRCTLIWVVMILYRCPGSKYWNKRCKADTDGGCAICISGNVSGLFVSVLLGR